VETDAGRVLGRDVADVRGEAVGGKEAVHAMHQPVADDLRDDRGGGDRRAALVAVDDGGVLGSGRAEPEAVDEADLTGRSEGVQYGAQAAEIADVKAVAVDPRRRERLDADPFRTADDSLEELLALLPRELLRVVQERERPHLRAAQRLVVEQDAGDEERPGQRPAPRLVGADDVAGADAPVEAK